jgi:type I restriction enzyme R subunit
LDDTKPHGNVVSFRNLKKATDTALALFGDENAKDIVFKKPYEEQKKEFASILKELKNEVNNPEAVDQILSEEGKAKFVRTFRDLLRSKSSLETFAEFSFEDVGIAEQEFYDYQSKYLDIYDSRKERAEGEDESEIDNMDFEIELTIRDIINYDYIIMLIVGIKDLRTSTEKEKRKGDILRIFDGNIVLRKKKDLIKKFIEENLPTLSSSEDIEKNFTDFWNSEKYGVLKKISEEENIPFGNLEKLIGDYLYTQKFPRDQDRGLGHKGFPVLE